MEKKRIFDRRMLCLLLVLCLANTFVYTYSQAGEGRFYGTENLWEFRVQYKKAVAEIRGDNKTCRLDQEESQEGGSREQADSAESTDRIRDEVLRQREYIESHGRRLTEIGEQARKLKSISVFADPESFSYRNIMKTQADLEALSAQTLTVGYDRMTLSVLEYRESSFFLIFFIIVFLFRLLGEQGKGMWRIVHSTARGRSCLCLDRLLCLAAGLTLYNILILFSELGCSLFLYGDMSEWNRAVQSIEALAFFPYPLTVAEYWLWYLAMQIVGSLILALTLWLILQSVRSWMLGLGIFAGVLTLEYLIGQSISEGSPFLPFTYINLYHCLRPGSNLTRYHNIAVSGMLLSCQRLFLTGAFLAVTIAAGALLLLARFQKESEISPEIKGFGHMQTILAERRFRRVRPVWLVEIRRMLMGRLGTAALLLLMILLYVRTRPIILYYSEADYLVNQFCQEYGGQDYSLGEAAVISWEKEMEAEKDRYMEAREESEEGSLSLDEYMMAEARWESFEGSRRALSAMQERLAFLKELEQERGIRGEFVDLRGYDVLIGPDGEAVQHLNAVFVISIEILLFANLCAGERKTGFRYLVFSTKYGRERWFSQKGKAAVLMTGFLWLTFILLDLLLAYRVYGLFGFTAPAQSFPLLEEFTLPVCLGVYFLFHCLIKLGIMLGIAVFMLLLSAYGTALGSVLIAVGVCFLPEILSRMGFSSFGAVSVLRFLCMTGVPAMRTGVWAATGFLTMGAGAWLAAGRHWAEVEEGR